MSSQAKEKKREFCSRWLKSFADHIWPWSDHVWRYSGQPYSDICCTSWAWTVIPRGRLRALHLVLLEHILDIQTYSGHMLHPSNGECRLIEVYPPPHISKHTGSVTGLMNSRRQARAVEWNESISFTIQIWGGHLSKIEFLNHRTSPFY